MLKALSENQMFSFTAQKAREKLDRSIPVKKQFVS